MVDLSIIIISFNTKKLTKGAVESVVKSTKNINYEFIIIDNNSTDESQEVLQELAAKYKNIYLILNKKNFGFGQANNQGMKVAKGRHVLLLNSDTLVKDNVLGEMISYLDKNPKIGVATCGLRFGDGIIQGTGGYFPTLFRVFAWMSFLDDIPLLDKVIKSYHPHHSLSPFGKNDDFFKSKKQVDWITGAFFLIKRDVMEKVGYFDKRYFMYVEEVDYCYRVKKLGQEVWYLSKWSIIHYGGASSKSGFALASEFEGLKTFYKIHMPLWQYTPLRLLLKWGALLRIFIFGKTYAKIFISA